MQESIDKNGWEGKLGYQPPGFHGCAVAGISCCSVGGLLSCGWQLEPSRWTIGILLFWPINRSGYLRSPKGLVAIVISVVETLFLGANRIFNYDVDVGSMPNLIEGLNVVVRGSRLKGRGREFESRASRAKGSRTMSRG